MAHIPTPERIAEIQAVTKQSIEAKIKEQKKQHKNFIPTGAGVIPEKDWKEMKK